MERSVESPSMHYIRLLLKRLSALFTGRGFGSLSTGIVIAMCAGLMLPAFVGGMALTNLNQERMNKELEDYLKDKIALLANSLSNPVWNYDTDAAKTIVDASLLDPQVVRITITVSDPLLNTFLSVERPERRLGKSRVAQHTLALSDESAGSVEVEVDDGLRQLKYEQDRRSYSFILLGQFVLALFLILIALRFRVLKPLADLATFSNQLGGGDFDHPVGWARSDEIGRLAHQLDQMRSDLRMSFAEQQAILGNIQVGVIFMREGVIQLANHHAEQIFGHAPGTMRGLKTGVICLSDEQFSAMNDRANAAFIAVGGRYEDELCLRRLDGSTFWARTRGCLLDPNAPEAGSIWVFEDITERKATEHEINSLAFYDPLTRLPNRRLLLDRLKQALASSVRSGRGCALLFIDLDDFKTLNDTLGHGMGDLLLLEVAQRLATCIREEDTVSRLGGDEFVAVLETLSENMEEAAAQAEAVGRKILSVLNQTYLLAGEEHHSAASIGITLFNDRQDTVEDLLKRADMAMYQAKAAGRNTLRFFNAEMQAAVTERAALEAGLHEAILKEQFLLYYQAQVSGDGQTTGAEVLVRWNHPQRGIVSPAEFITLAEETGLILPLGHWVLNTACTRLALWAKQPEMARLSLAVNVSARQFHRDDFVEQVLAVLERTGADPQRLKLELTESLLISNIEDVIAKMSELKKFGVGFSLDDFGTGYSSLSYLKRLPLDQLKIDQGFVRDILVDPNDAAIAKMIVALSESLGLAVIAEGVETEAQRDFLAHHGCHACQGYLFSRPLPLDEFEVFATQN